jgi:V8-like Glu-specific endopeptidase
MRLFILIICLFLQCIHNSVLANEEITNSILQILSKSAPELVARNKIDAVGAIVSIRLKSMAGPQELANRRTRLWGTGVLVAPNMVLTNNHVINRKSLLPNTILVVDHYAQSNVHKSKPVILNPVKKGLFYTNANLDFTIFEIEPTKGRHFVQGLTDKSRYNTSVTRIFSYPGGHHAKSHSSTKGLIGRSEVEEHGVEFRTSAFYHLNNTYSGSSGAPILDSNYKLLGIHRKSNFDDKTRQAYVQEGVSYKAIIDNLNGKSLTLDAESVRLTKYLQSSLEGEQYEFAIESLILGLEPGHEVLTLEAIYSLEEDEYPLLQNNYIQTAMVKGNVDVDYPTYWGILVNPYELYQSHYGKKQYLHSMLTEEESLLKGVKQSKAINEKIKNYLYAQLNKFFELEKIDVQLAVRELGRILHTLQDSYSSAHTDRNQESISKFYYYADNEHDKDLHKKLDFVKDANGEFTTTAKNAIEATSIFLSAVYTGSYIQRKNNAKSVISNIFTIDHKEAKNRFNLRQKVLSIPVAMTVSLHKVNTNNGIARMSLDSKLESSVSKNIFKETLTPVDCCPPNDDDIFR